MENLDFKLKAIKNIDFLMKGEGSEREQAEIGSYLRNNLVLESSVKTEEGYTYQFKENWEIEYQLYLANPERYIEDLEFKIKTKADLKAKAEEREKLKIRANSIEEAKEKGERFLAEKQALYDATDKFHQSLFTKANNPVERIELTKTWEAIPSGYIPIHNGKDSKKVYFEEDKVTLKYKVLEIKYRGFRINVSLQTPSYRAFSSDSKYVMRYYHPDASRNNKSYTKVSTILERVDEEADYIQTKLKSEHKDKMGAKKFVKEMLLKYPTAEFKVYKEYTNSGWNRRMVRITFPSGNYINVKVSGKIDSETREVSYSISETYHYFSAKQNTFDLIDALSK